MREHNDANDCKCQGSKIPAIFTKQTPVVDGTWWWGMTGLNTKKGQRTATTR